MLDTRRSSIVSTVATVARLTSLASNFRPSPLDVDMLVMVDMALVPDCNLLATDLATLKLLHGFELLDVCLCERGQ